MPADHDEDRPPPELAVASDLLTAVFAENHEAVLEFRELDGVSWWNVALSYAHLMKSIFSGDPGALRVLAATVEDARESGSTGGASAR